MSKKGKKISLIVFASLIFLMIAFFLVVAIYLMPVDFDNENTYTFEIATGTGKGQIADNLKESDLIKSSFFLKVYMTFSNPTLYAGTYKLSPSMSAIEIIEKLESADSLENETITLTFIEGKRLSHYVTQISENFNILEDDIYEKLSDSEFLTSLIDKYWFLSKDILNSEIYYPLEGYIYPDTYEFKKNSTIEEVIIKTLDNMNTKLTEYKEEIELLNLTPHELLTFASIVELEGASSDDRAGVAGVFYNRLESNWSLDSDVTTYYAVKKDFSVDLLEVDLQSCNGYNTNYRNNCQDGLPIGPICSSSLESIVAVIAPKEHDYYYFVADINKETYFTYTEAEHNQVIQDLKNKGLWLEY